MDDRTPPEFDFEAVFEVDDYLYFYGDMLTEELAEQQPGACATGALSSGTGFGKINLSS